MGRLVDTEVAGDSIAATLRIAGGQRHEQALTRRRGRSRRDRSPFSAAPIGEADRSTLPRSAKPIDQRW
jgi:hypothetical protein